MAKKPDDRVQTAFDDAVARLETARTQLQSLYEQFAALRTKGAELEKQIFEIEGEVKALASVGGKRGH